ncbi:MAG: hypothetical protein ICV80_07940, partial [Microcoleus sp. T1-bin1]|nr:hypothetical protein [Microcoleus sp. T1-bin1]
NSMLLAKEMYESQDIGSDFCLAKISDFNSLIGKSQEHQTPVFALTSEQIEQSGKVLTDALKAQEPFREAFSKLADRVIGLTCHAASN